MLHGKQNQNKVGVFYPGVKRGVEERTAAIVFNGNKGRWNLSISNAVHLAWRNQWFAQMGLKTISDLKLSHWLPLRIWRKLL